MDNIFRTAAMRDLMRAKMRVVVERALHDVEAEDYLLKDWSNYEDLVRREFVILAQAFAEEKT